MFMCDGERMSLENLKDLFKILYILPKIRREKLKKTESTDVSTSPIG